MKTFSGTLINRTFRVPQSVDSSHDASETKYPTRPPTCRCYTG